MHNMIVRFSVSENDWHLALAIVELVFTVIATQSAGQTNHTLPTNGIRIDGLRALSVQKFCPKGQTIY